MGFLIQITQRSARNMATVEENMREKIFHCWFCNHVLGGKREKKLDFFWKRVATTTWQFDIDWSRSQINICGIEENVHTFSLDVITVLSYLTDLLMWPRNYLHKDSFSYNLSMSSYLIRLLWKYDGIQCSYTWYNTAWPHSF